MFELIPFDRWGIAIFDVNWEYRVKLDEILDEKETYMLGVYLGQLNAAGIDIESATIIREEIGREVQKVEKRINMLENNLAGEKTKDESVA